MNDGTTSIGDSSLLVVALGVGGALALVMAAAVSFRIFLRTRRGGGNGGSAADRAAAEVAAVRALLDLEFLDQLASAATPERVAELFTAMEQDCRGLIANMRQAAKMYDYGAVQEECVALAESCDAFGAIALAQMARNLYRALEDEAFRDADRKIAEMDKTTNRTFDAISSHLRLKGRRRAVKRVAA